jgi:hypothetical protein
MASRDVIRIGASVNDLGYNLRDPWWGVPRVSAIVLSVIAEQFHKLCEVSLPRENALNRAVEVVSVSGDLETILTQALLKSSQELDRCFLGALPDLEVRNQLCFFVQTDENPLIANFGRIALADCRAFFPT